MNHKTLTELLGPIVADCGLEVDAIEVVPAGQRRLVRVTLDGDGPQGSGPDLDQIAEATRAISRALDEADVVGTQPYTLEVSSRGVGRPLTTAAHFRRNRGRLLSCTLSDGSRLTGRLKDSDADGATLDVDGHLRLIGLDQITKALVQVELNPPTGADDEAADAGELE